MKKSAFFFIFIFTVNIFYAETSQFNDHDTAKEYETDYPAANDRKSYSKKERVHYYNSYQITSKRMFSLALALFIPGQVFFAGNLIIGTLPVVNYYTSDLGEKEYYKEYYDYDQQIVGIKKVYKKIEHDKIPGIMYASIMVSGGVLLIASIPFFIASGLNFKLYKQTKVTLFSDFDNKHFSMGLNLSF